MTALFADIVGSTALGELLGMEEVKALVGECVSRISEVIERYGGVVGAYMGDGVAAFFGLEAAGEDDQHRAALAALELRRVVAEYANEAKQAWGVEDLNVRVGINAGRVATGPVGGSQRRTLALGDPVNVAARLQAIADPGSIVVGAGMANALAGHFRTQHLGQVSLKGRVKKADAFVLVDEVPAVDGGVQRSIVGRDGELTNLKDCLANLSSGRGQVILILGEAGIGKTRLLDEMRQRASANVMWLGARSSPAERRLPYAPFLDALRSWLGLAVGVPEIAVRVRLRARLQELMGEAGENLVAPLARLLGVRPRTRGDQQLEGLPIEVLTRSLHGAYTQWLTALARSIPVVLAIDNFGMVDESVVQLAEEILSVTDAAPLLVAMTMRPDASAVGWRLRVRALSEYAHRTEELRLEGLSLKESDALFAALDTKDAVGERLRSTLVQRAEGNPLYLEELFNTVAGDALVGEPSREPDAALPPALESLLLSRIDRLPVDARDLLQAAGVLGREFSKDVVARMNEVEDLDATLATLLRADLIRERRRDPAEYAFKHGLLREASLSTLTNRRRRELHARAAIAIEATCGPDLRESVGELAWHYFTAGDTRKGVDFLQHLGERFASVYRYDQAIDVLEECRSRLGEGCSTEGYKHITQRLAELRARTGDSQGAIELLDELRRTVSEGGEAVRLQALRAQVLAESGNLEAATTLLASSLQGALEKPMEQKLKALSAQVALRRQDFATARTFLEGLGEIGAADPELGFETASSWAGYLAAVGDFAAARGWGEQALIFARTVGRASVELRARQHLGVLQLLNGRVSAGHSHMREVFDSCSELGFTIGAMESGINVAHSACLLGALAEAESVSDRMLERTESPFWQSFIRSNLATIKFEMNDLEAAEAHATWVLSVASEVGPPAPRIAARGAMFRVRAANEDWELAENEIRLAQDEAKRLSGRRGLGVSLRTALSDLALRQGDWETALYEADKAYEEIEFVEKPMHACVLRLRGAALVRCDPVKGRMTLEDARSMSRVMEMKLEEARTLVAIGLSSPDESTACFDEAGGIFSDCGCLRGLTEVAQARTGALQA